MKYGETTWPIPKHVESQWWDLIRELNKHAFTTDEHYKAYGWLESSMRLYITDTSTIRDIITDMRHVDVARTNRGKVTMKSNSKVNSPIILSDEIGKLLRVDLRRQLLATVNTIQYNDTIEIFYNKHKDNYTPASLHRFINSVSDKLREDEAKPQYQEIHVPAEAKHWMIEKHELFSTLGNFKDDPLPEVCHVDLTKTTLVNNAKGIFVISHICDVHRVLIIKDLD